MRADINVGAKKRILDDYDSGLIVTFTFNFSFRKYLQRHTILNCITIIGRSTTMDVAS